MQATWFSAYIATNCTYPSQKERSRTGGYFFMSDNADGPADNGAVLNTATIIKAVMSLEAEAEI